MTADPDPVTARRRAPDAHPALALAVVFAPIAIWGYLLAGLANEGGQGAGTTAFVLVATFGAGLLLLKPLLLSLAVFFLARSLWGWWRKKEMDRRWEQRGARLFGLVYAPIFGVIASVVGVWDGWDPGGWSALGAALAYGAAGFVHAVLVSGYTVWGATAVFVVSESTGSEAASDGGAGSSREKPKVVSGTPASPPPPAPDPDPAADARVQGRA